jgi:hypothetical protein
LDVDTIAELETAIGGSNLIISTEIDTIAELETLLGSVNVILATEIDTSSELSGILGDETGSSGGFARAGSPTFTGTVTVDQFVANHTSQNDANGGTIANSGVITPSTSTNIIRYSNTGANAGINLPTPGTAFDWYTFPITNASGGTTIYTNYVNGIATALWRYGLNAGVTTWTNNAGADSKFTAEVVGGVWKVTIESDAWTGGSSATDSDAIHDNVAGEISAVTDKATPVTGDHLLIEDSAASDAKKDITIGSLETALEGVIDLQELQGAVTDAQVPNTITIDVAALASTVTVVDGTDSTSFVGIYDSATGSLAPKTDAALTYDASNGKLTATTVDLGNTDTTIARLSAGDISVEGNAVYRAGGTDVPVADGGTGISSGTSGGVPYFSGSTTIASSGALAANALVIGGGAGAAPSTISTSAGIAAALSDEIGTGRLVHNISTTLTNLTVDNGGTLNGSITNTTLTASRPVFSGSAKELSSSGTIDPLDSGITLKQTKYIQLIRPDYGDGAGAIPQTNSYTASGLMHYTFSGSADTNANFVVYEFTVPSDIDTSVAMTATFAWVSGGTDADDVAFDLSYGQGTAGAAWPPALTSGYVRITTTPTSPASGDLQKSAATTLTSWAGSMTAGGSMAVKVARVNNSNDDTARDVSLVIAYGSTQ